MHFSNLQPSPSFSSACGWYSENPSCCSSDDATAAIQAAGLGDFYLTEAPFMDVLPMCWNLMAQLACAPCSPLLSGFYGSLGSNNTRMLVCREFCESVFDACRGSNLLANLYPRCTTKDACCSSYPAKAVGACFYGTAAGKSVGAAWALLVAAMFWAVAF